MTPNDENGKLPPSQRPFRVLIVSASQRRQYMGTRRRRTKWAGIKLFWRDRAMRVGHPPAESSPQAQQAADLNQDARLFPQQSEGERLRK